MTQGKHISDRWVTDLYGSFKTMIRREDERGNGRKIAITWVGDANPKRRVGESREEFAARFQAAHLERARENEAHARLIAAAPEMLEVLRDALGTIRSASRALSDEHKLVLGGKPWGGRDIAAIEAVIAKAEGW